MEKRSCFELGYLGKVHGLDGSLVAVLDVDQPALYRKLDAVFIDIKGQLVPYPVSEIKSLRGNQMILRLAGVESAEDAGKLKGSALFLPETALPPPAPGKFYFHELVGCRVEDAEKGTLGVITGIVDLPSQVLATMDWQEGEVLIPLHDDILLGFDRKEKRVKTRLPEGLLDVYAKTESPETHAD
jgi:16S rRNA processing protein RimM